MALTIEEEARFQELDKKISGAALGLSDEEEARFQELDKKFAAEDPGSLEAFKEGALDELTFGFSPEITAATRSTFGDITFEDALKEEREETAAALKLQPGSFKAGRITADVASLAIGGGVLKGISTLAKTAKGLSALSKAKKAGSALKQAAKKIPKTAIVKKAVSAGKGILKSKVAKKIGVSSKTLDKGAKLLKGADKTGVAIDIGIDIAVDSIVGIPGVSGIARTMLAPAVKILTGKVKILAKRFMKDGMSQEDAIKKSLKLLTEGAELAKKTAKGSKASDLLQGLKDAGKAFD